MNALVKFPAIPKTNPFFNGFFDELFDRSIGDFIGSDVSMPHRPAANILETEDNFKIELLAPGFEKSDFKIAVDGDYLTISAEKKSETSETKEKFTRREFHFANFKRTFTLPKTVKHDEVSANFENGVLNLSIPKREEAKKITRNIEVA